MSAAPSDRENFELWVGGPLEAMLAQPHAGFVVAMVAFPVLERYLRGKSGAAPDKPGFQAALVEVIPELRNTQAAGTFWFMFRHSLLHYAGFQQPNYAFVSSAELVSVSERGEVWMNPDCSESGCSKPFVLTSQPTREEKCRCLVCTTRMTVPQPIHRILRIGARVFHRTGGRNEG